MDKIKSLADLKKKRGDINADMSRQDAEHVVQIKVAMSTCGIASGSKPVMDSLIDACKMQNVNANVSQTGCMGYCYAEPTVEITKQGQEPVVFGYVTIEKAKTLVEKYILNNELVEDVIPQGYLTIDSDKKQASEDKKQLRIALRNCGFIDPENIEEYIFRDGYAALADVLEQNNPAAAIEVVKKSGLRGRGGGGFPTGLKWELASKNPSDQKYMICNADEGDPGAFMDRSILEGDPHSVIEAMIIGGFCIGATKGLVYIRAEYPLAIKRLEIAIGQAERYGLLGKNILGSGFDFELELRYGAGAFVCGEETALIHSMEGLRGEPTFKPPFPAQEGYLKKPSNVNNVETFANIPVILNKGWEWFSSIGTEKSKGTKVFALAGQINNVGLIEVPMGVTLREIIFEIGGGIKNDKKFKAVQTGGPSGGCLTEDFLDTPIDYDNLLAAGSMMGSGGMIVMDETSCMPAVARFYLDFTVEESCGKCTPCRIGNKRLCEILDKIIEGKGTMDDLDILKNLSNVIKDTALCGLGQTSPNPILSTIDHFWDEYLAHVVDKKCPAGQCKAMKQYIINAEACIGCTACSRACPTGAVSGEKKMPHTINQDLCIKCNACYDKCKFNAISIK